uniref:Phosphatidylinositol-glycan biosynthesis class F protein n=1 Tax=Oryza glumipatula TaxID=40148 RepID=A0A0D9Z1K8_9ORYZ
MGDEATQVSASSAVAVHALCFAGIVAAHQLSGRGMLVSNPAYALRLLVVFEAPLVIAVFSLLCRNPKRCSFLKAAARGLLGLPIGAFLNAFGAIVLGAPIGIKIFLSWIIHINGPFTGLHICRYWAATTYWSLLMSLFTFVPAACVFGASKVNWQAVLSHSIYCGSTDSVDYMISAPAHGAVIGAWLGAWPMPLDWERPWQEWPISVTYGSVAGHLIGMAISLALVVTHKRRGRAKAD